MNRVILPKTLGVRPLRPIISVRWAHEGSYKSPDSNVETDEIISENNPWSPTLLEDIVKVRKPGSIRSVELPENFRLSYQPIYEAPASKYVSLLKRLTISIGVLGCYAAKLFFDSPHFDDYYAIMTLGATFTPAAVVQYKTRNYVTRIFRLYDKNKPQTLENLVLDEKLIMEKLTVTGGKTYNQLLQISNNDTLGLVPKPRFPLAAPYGNWQDIDRETNFKRKFYVVDDVGGMKMDRIWGIIEKNSGVDNGRFIDHHIHEKQPENYS